VTPPQLGALSVPLKQEEMLKFRGPMEKKKKEDVGGKEN